MPEYLKWNVAFLHESWLPVGPVLLTIEIGATAVPGLRAFTATTGLASVPVRWTPVRLRFDASQPAWSA